MKTLMAGTFNAAIWRSSNSERTPCIATRSNRSLTVVTTPTISASPSRRASQRANALSLPELHDTKAFGGTSLGVRATAATKSPLGPRWSRPNLTRWIVGSAHPVLILRPGFSNQPDRVWKSRDLRGGSRLAHPQMDEVNWNPI